MSESERAISSGAIDYEVELKFCIEDDADVTALLGPLGATAGAVLEQRDVYLAHPSRDFAVTDEAVRIRSIGDENRLTYKGPLVDMQTKTRQEVEVAFAPGKGNRSALLTLLESLGFRPVGEVHKHRTTFHLDWEGRTVEVAADSVAGLGSFLELETIASDTGWEAARDSLLRLAAKLNLQNAERRSYLQLLLERGAGT